VVDALHVFPLGAERDTVEIAASFRRGRVAAAPRSAGSAGCGARAKP
jgi:hypothetical protein